MALFKFRKSDDDRLATGQPESAEVLRRRARHRLIGACVLVLLAVIGFPLIFDTQPRPIAVDIPIEIPDRGKAKPLAPPSPPPTAAATGAAPSEPPAAASASASSKASAPKTEAKAEAKAETKVATAASLDAKEQVIPAKPEAAPAKAEPNPANAAKATKPEAAKTETKTEAKAETKAEPAKPAPRLDDGARAKALLEGKSPEAAAPTPAAAQAAVEGRFVVQIGAFAEQAKAQEVRRKVERAGLKTYAQVADTKDGKRIRVRVGPYGTRAEAEKAASKIKGLELPANILTL